MTLIERYKTGKLLPTIENSDFKRKLLEHNKWLSYKDTGTCIDIRHEIISGYEHEENSLRLAHAFYDNTVFHELKAERISLRGTPIQNSTILFLGCKAEVLDIEGVIADNFVFEDCNIEYINLYYSQISSFVLNNTSLKHIRLDSSNIFIKTDSVYNLEGLTVVSSMLKARDIPKLCMDDMTICGPSSLVSLGDRGIGPVISLAGLARNTIYYFPAMGKYHMDGCTYTEDEFMGYIKDPDSGKDREEVVGSTTWLTVRDLLNISKIRYKEFTDSTEAEVRAELTTFLNRREPVPLSVQSEAW